jgi:CheY-like chemotaxis protein
MLVGSSQKLRAVAEAEGGAGPESERRLGVQATLVSLLEKAFGSRGTAVSTLERVLALAGRDRLPDEPAEAVAFMRAHLLGALSADLGPRLTMALVDDFVECFDLPPPVAAPSAPPPSKPWAVARVSLKGRHLLPVPAELRVLLVDADRVGRASLARALVRARWDVSVVESAEDVREAVHGEAPPDAAIVDLHHPAADPILEAIVDAMPGLIIVVRGADGPEARQRLGAAMAGRFEIRSPEAPAEELIEAVKRAVEG